MPRPDRFELPSLLTLPLVAKLVPSPEPAPAPNMQAQIEVLLIQRHSQVAVLAASTGDIVYISGKSGRYLEPATGKANLNLFAMARDGLRGELGEAFARALRQKNVIERKGIPMAGW